MNGLAAYWIHMFVFFCVNVCLLPNQFNYDYPVELGLDQDNLIDRKDGAKILKAYGLRKRGICWDDGIHKAKSYTSTLIRKQLSICDWIIPPYHQKMLQS